VHNATRALLEHADLVIGVSAVIIAAENAKACRNVHAAIITALPPITGAGL
jgi:hypothetical protein